MGNKQDKQYLTCICIWYLKQSQVQKWENKMLRLERKKIWRLKPINIVLVSSRVPFDIYHHKFHNEHIKTMIQLHQNFELSWMTWYVDIIPETNPPIAYNSTLTSIFINFYNTLDYLLEGSKSNEYLIASRICFFRSAGSGLFLDSCIRTGTEIANDKNQKKAATVLIFIWLPLMILTLQAMEILSKNQ